MCVPGEPLALLKQAYCHRELQLYGRLTDPGAWEHWLNRSVRQEWVVYAKPPFGSPEAVLKYLARSTHHVAISNRRLLKLAEGQVTFRVRDSADQRRSKPMTLDAVELLRRFLMHVLPRGFMRIRHFGFGGNRCRTAALEACRRLLAEHQAEHSAEGPPPESFHDEFVKQESTPRCPVCHTGRLRILRQILPEGRAPRGLRLRSVPVLRYDTS